MKALKGSLVALVAILAVGLTVAMQAGAFENKAARVGECYFEAVVLDDENSCAQVVLDAADPCTIKPTIAGDAILSLGASFTTNPSIPCPGGSQFCCLEIVANPQVLCSNPIIDPAGSPVAARYRVTSDVTKIFCQN